MKRSLAWLGSAILVLFLLTACSGGGGGGDDSDDTGTIPEPSGPPANVVLTVVPNLDDETFTINARVTDASGAPVNDGTPVVFSASSGDLSQLQVGTSNGEATTVLSNPGAASVTIGAIVNATVSGETTLNISGPPANIVVTSNLPPNAFLAPGESTSITAFVTDVVGQPVYDGTRIFFSTNGVAATIEESATTRDGFATATFTAGPTAGSVIVTGASEVDPQTGLAAIGTTEVPVSDGDAASITFISVTPDDFIGVKGSGQNEIAEMIFGVFDAAGNPIPDGTEITFSLNQALNSGARLLNTSASSIDGEVSVRVQSGFVAGPLRVTASFTNTQGMLISSQGVVTVVSGSPDNEHFTISQTLFNQSGFVQEGLLNNFNVSLADRFGNVIKDGTPVSFISDCGRIGVNADGVDELGSFVITTIDGKASAEFRTSNPVKELCTIVAYTPGQEAFDDLNANGVYDPGTDICTGDAPEPFVDENLDGSYTSGELFIDTNGNGRYDRANNQCDMETLLWDDANVMMTANIGIMNIVYFDPEFNGFLDAPFFGLQLLHGESLFLRFTAQDTNGNALVAGTTVTVAADCAENELALFASGLVKDGNGGTITLPDRIGSGDTFGVTLQDLTVHADDEEPKTCRIDFTITPPDNQTTTGNHGGVTRFNTIFVEFGRDAAP